MLLSLRNRSSELLISPFQKWKPLCNSYLSLIPDGELLWNRGCIQIIMLPASTLCQELSLVLCEHYF